MSWGDNWGVLWRVDKGDNPKRPDWRGTVTINGVPYVIAGWKAKRKDDREVVQIRVEPASGANILVPPREPLPPSPQKSFRFDPPKNGSVQHAAPRRRQPDPGPELIDDAVPF
jgi:hypothetical protein